jgi:hypothetical protein
MASSPTTGGNPENFASLRQTFESAVHELGGAEPDRAKQPIYPRKKELPPSSEPNSHNRALQDAAEALAALWRTPGARPHRSNRK